MRDRLILVVREILKRPSLNDAIMDCEGYITRDSLRTAATTLRGNSSTGTFSQDPFHGLDNAAVVRALQGYFKHLRDETKDRRSFFEEFEYVEIALLKAVMNDPDEVDSQSLSILDPSTGLPRKKYSEHCVYMAKNIIERPGLLRSLVHINSVRLFGRLKPTEWLSNTGLERWLERYEVYKAR